MIDYTRYIVEVLSSAQEGSSGSGVLYYPDDSESAVIITAKHVLENSEVKDLDICSIRMSSGKTQGISLNDYLDDSQIHRSDTDDLALILVPLSIIKGITGDLTQLPSVDRRFDFEFCQSLGYPHANDGTIKLLNSQFRAFNAKDKHLIEATTAHHEDLVTKYADAIDNVKGMSGGAFFYSDGTKYFFAGITSEFHNKYKDFVSVDLKAVNRLLTQTGISPLEFTYGSKEGLDADWFRNHINSSCKALEPRYTPEVNFEVSQADYFKYLSQGIAFREDVKDNLHRIIKSINKNIYLINRPHSQAINQHVLLIISSIRKFFTNSDLSVNGSIHHLTFLHLLNKSLDTLEELNSELERKSLELYRKQKTSTTTAYSYFDRDPYREEVNKTRNIINDLYDLRYYLKSSKVNLINEKTLLLNGDAGNGKSHLLGDMSSERNKLGLPSILILGSHLQGQSNPKSLILDNLNLKGQYSFNELVIQLNAIGEFVGERVLIMIDALNEGPMHHHWDGYIADMIDEIKKYPYLGFVFSIRSGYEEDILPQTILKDEPFVKVTHTGFQENPLEAIKHFCKYFNLNEPSIPILTPEFTKPQFLLLTCQTLQRNGESDFPKGLGGITNIYENYTVATAKKIVDNINKLSPLKIAIPKSCNLVEDGIFHLLQLGFKTTYNAKIVEDHFVKLDKYAGNPSGLTILQQLTSEHILTQKIFNSKKKREAYYEFNYQLYAQHVFVAKVLNDIEGDLENLLKKGGILHKLCNNYLTNKPLLTAFAIQIPEKYGIELYELISEEWLSQIGENAQSKFVKILFVTLDSMLWRNTSSLDSQKCKSIVISLLNHYKGDQDILNILMTLSCVEDHPLNADFLHDYMMMMSMAERDEFWAAFTYESFSDPKTMTSRLIDWILDYSDYTALSSKASELALTVLSWFTSSTFSPLRDSATIAIVKILDIDLSKGLFLIKKFKGIDDYFLLERVICAIYGACLRSDDLSSLGKLSDYIYSEYFDSTALPVHFMIRDYSRCIIEYYQEKSGSSTYDPKVFKPPYDSSISFVNADFNDIASKYKVEISPELDEIEKSKLWAINEVVTHYEGEFSFSDSRIYKAIEEFHCVSFTAEIRYAKILGKLPLKCRAKLERQKQLIFEMGEADSNIKEGYYTTRQQQLFNSKRDATEEDKIVIKQQKAQYKKEWQKKKNDAISEYNGLKTVLTRISKILCRKDYFEYILPYFDSLRYTTSNYIPKINPNIYKPWLVAKIYELGFSPDKHKYFDADYSGYKFRDSKHEKYKGGLYRISEKYRHIANMELLARLADNFQFYDKYKEPKFRKFNYQGQELDFRDIDPSITLYSSIHENKIDSKTFSDYNNWQIDHWLKRVDDLPGISHLLSYTDSDINWVPLHLNMKFRNITELGSDDFSKGVMDLDICINSLLVANSNKEQVVQHYINLGYTDDQYIVKHPYYCLFDKEFNQTQKYRYFSDISNREIDYLPVYGHPLYDYFYASSGYNEFQSDVSLVKPSRYLSEILSLHHSNIEGAMADESGDIVVKCLNELGWTNFFISKKKLLFLLEDTDCSLIWHLKGRKLIQGGKSTYPQTQIVATMSMDSSGEIIIEENYNIDKMYRKNL